eukprot:EG_transcript_9453
MLLHLYKKSHIICVWAHKTLGCQIIWQLDVGGGKLMDMKMGTRTHGQSFRRVKTRNPMVELVQKDSSSPVLTTETTRDCKFYFGGGLRERGILLKLEGRWCCSGPTDLF